MPGGARYRIKRSIDGKLLIRDSEKKVWGPPWENKNNLVPQTIATCDGHDMDNATFICDALNQMERIKKANYKFKIILP
jgi:hypothetical protein